MRLVEWRDGESNVFYVVLITRIGFLQVVTLLVLSVPVAANLVTRH